MTDEGPGAAPRGGGNPDGGLGPPAEGGPELVVLGAGSALPRRGFGSSGYALRPAHGAPWTLLDCGPGSVRMLGAVGIDLREVDRVVFSHWHTDHCLDLFALFFARRNPALEGLPRLDLIGPRGLRALVEGGPGVLGHWVEERDCSVTELEPRDGRIAFERDGLRGVGYENGHAPAAVSWRFELAEVGVLCYSGDSGEAEGLVRAARGADLFLCECAFPDEEAVEHHLTPTSVGRVARRAGVRRLLLTHFYPALDPDLARRGAAAEFDGPISTAHDGLRVPLAAR
ncbi:MAG: MBL fold metallo-hydrolase [Planctomycetota bacterium]